MPQYEIRKPIPIPQPGDYEVAAEILDDQFNNEGGAWTSYHKETLISIYNKVPTYDVFENIASIARFVEPIKNNNYHPIDSEYKATHAFKAGMWTGGRMIRLTYDEFLGYPYVHNSLNDSLLYKKYTDQSEYEANGTQLVGIGHEGMQMVGFETRQFFDTWGKDIVAHEDIRKYYALGASAVLYTAHEVYSQVYTDLNYSYQAAQAFDEQELNDFLAAAAGSSES